MPMGKKIIWTPEMEALIGTMSDRAVAEILGISSAAVQTYRFILDIPPFQQHNLKAKWTPEMDALLGTTCDWKVAEQLGLKTRVVHLRRRKLGISAFGSTATKWTSEMEVLLGTKIDREVAEELGIGRTAVKRRRRELGIPSWFSQQYFPNRRHREASALDALTREQWLFACEWFEDCCAYCGEFASLTEDHLVPLSKGGPRTALNIVPCCQACNNSKYVMQAHIWIYWKFGKEQGNEIIADIVDYLTEVQERLKDE